MSMNIPRISEVSLQSSTTAIHCMISLYMLHNNHWWLEDHLFPSPTASKYKKTINLKIHIQYMSNSKWTPSDYIIFICTGLMFTHAAVVGRHTIRCSQVVHHPLWNVGLLCHRGGEIQHPCIQACSSSRVFQLKRLHSVQCA